ncbi:MAG: DUF1559 domain-containing protein [Pirellulales bacterium]|nr:DUF1559 domain-containing protein [Pirellulales bacterium]
MKRRPGFAKAGLVAVLAICCFLLVCMGLTFPLEFAFYVLFGWIVFLKNTLPQASVEPAAIAVGAAALTAMIVLLHLFSRGLYRQIHRERPDCPPWKFRWSISIVFLVVSLFTAGICLLVMIHETGWLLMSDKSIIGSAGFEAARRANSVNNLKQIGLGMHNYHDKHKEFPPGGTFNKYGEMMHSWETMLLPHIEYDRIKPDLKLPWNHPKNKEHFQVQIQEFFNPSETGPTVDENGYALSHYSLNGHAFRGNYAVKIKDVTDGTAYTIMAGEASGNFKPWGHPINWRDPSVGLGVSPDGFGGSHPSVTVFLMMDGGARSIRNDIDPKVLRALCTPAGGEPPRQEEW